MLAFATAYAWPSGPIPTAGTNPMAHVQTGLLCQALAPPPGCPLPSAFALHAAGFPFTGRRPPSSARRAITPETYFAHNSMKSFNESRVRRDCEGRVNAGHFGCAALSSLLSKVHRRESNRKCRV